MTRVPQVWIALLRGVNVGGNNKLPMKQFAALLATLELTSVKTYIQSGNAVFRGPKGPATALADAIASAIEETFEFRPRVIALTRNDLANAIAANPFPEGDDQDGRKLHLFFLGRAPKAIDAAGLEAVKRPTERWKADGPYFYLYAPEGFGTSKLAGKVEKCVGVPATARNWRTVRELLKLADAIA